jgi:hypothetical protein
VHRRDFFQRRHVLQAAADDQARVQILIVDREPQQVQGHAISHVRKENSDAAKIGAQAG